MESERGGDADLVLGEYPGMRSMLFPCMYDMNMMTSQGLIIIIIGQVVAIFLCHAQGYASFPEKRFVNSNEFMHAIGREVPWFTQMDRSYLNQGKSFPLSVNSNSS